VHKVEIGAGVVARHPYGAAVEREGVGEVEHGGVEDGVRVERRGAPDVVGEHADDAGGGLDAAADDAEVAVELAGLGAEERLSELCADEAGNEDDEGDGGGEGDEGREELGGGGGEQEAG
jgi:hypothetical protein